MAPAPALNSTLGAMEIGAMLSIFLFGFVAIQAFTYFSNNSSNDSWQIRTLVGFVCVMELAHTVLVSMFIYGKTITFFGDFETLGAIPTELGLSIALTGFIGPSVQAFYAFRIFKLSGILWIPVICWGLSVTRCAMLMACSIAAFIEPDIIKFKLRFSWLVICSLALSAAPDALITGSTCYYLWSQRSSALQRSQNMVDKMIFWTIQTGLLTSIITLSMLVIVLTLDNFVWIGLLFVVSRSLSNSLLSTLNSRSNIRESGRSTDLVEMPTTFRARVYGASTIEIEMTKTREVTGGEE